MLEIAVTNHINQLTMSRYSHFAFWEYYLLLNFQQKRFQHRFERGGGEAGTDPTARKMRGQ